MSCLILCIYSSIFRIAFHESKIDDETRKKHEKWDKWYHSGSRACIVEDVTINLAPTKSVSGGFVRAYAIIRPNSVQYTTKQLEDPNHKAYYLKEKYAESVVYVGPKTRLLKFPKYYMEVRKIRDRSRRGQAYQFWHQNNKKSSTTRLIKFTKQEPQ